MPGFEHRTYRATEGGLRGAGAMLLCLRRAELLGSLRMEEGEDHAK